MSSRVLARTTLLLTVLMIVTTTVTQSSQAANPSTFSEAAASTAAPLSICAFDQPDHFLYLPRVSGGSGEPSQPQPVTRELQYEVGKSYLYDYHFITDTTINTYNAEEGVIVGQPNLTLLYGTAEIVITGFENDDTYAGEIALNGMVLCTKSGDDGTIEFVNDANILAAIETPVLFKQTVLGEIVEVQIAENIDPVLANYAKGVLNAFQVTLAEGANYTAEETGVQGVYNADYTATLQKDGLALNKSLTQDSFLKFDYQGDETSFELVSDADLLLDREQGVFSYVSAYEVVSLLPPAEEDLQGGIDGATMWGQTNASGTLQLTAVTDVQLDQHFQIRASNTYTMSSMGAASDELGPITGGVDLDTVDLNAELDAFEANFDDPAYFQQLKMLINADKINEATDAVLNGLNGRLTTHLDNEPLAQAYISLLGYADTPATQMALVNVVDLNTTTPSTATKKAAVFELSLSAEPIPASYMMMTTLMNSDTVDPALRTTAVMASGSMSAALSQSDPAVSQALYDGLSKELSDATTDKQVEVALFAIGNSANAEIFAVLEPYLTNTNVQVQAAAYYGLRNVPTEEAENLLIDLLEPVIGLDDEPWIYDPFLVPTGLQALKDKPGKPSDDMIDVFSAYYGDSPNPPGGTLMDSWNPKVGGDNVGGYLPGGYIIQSPPDSGRLRANAHQSFEYHLYAQDLNIAKTGTIAFINATIEPLDDNPDIQQLSYDYDLLGLMVDEVEMTIACGGGNTIPIVNNTKSLFDEQFEYPLWAGLKVGVEFSASANYGISYNYDWNVCNPADMSGSAGLTAHANIHANASGYAGIPLLRGGVQLDVDVIDVEIPATISATYKLAGEEGLVACIHVPVELTALDMSLYFYVKAGTKKKWVYLLNKNIWDKSVVQDDYDLVPEICITPPEE